MAPKINVKERFNDGEVDLSMSDLNEVPVKDILTLKRIHSLDLSNNCLTMLPKNFSSLTTLTVLDLSKNELKELPEDFGNLVKLRHLDLYRNQLQHLPLSFSKLKNLKWLDLKDNPLVPAVAKVAGLCIDTKACQSCAKNIVDFFGKLETQVTAELEMRNKSRQKQLELNQKKKQEEKKEKKREKQKEKKNTAKPVEFKRAEVAKINNNVHKTNKSTAIDDKSSLSSIFLKLLFVLVTAYLTFIIIKNKDSKDIFNSVQNRVILDYAKISDISQVWWSEMKKYVENVYKNYT